MSTKSQRPPQTRRRNQTTPNVTYVRMNDLKHQADLLRMMRGLYAEDEAASPVDQSRFPVNVQYLVSHPSSGSIVLFRHHGTLCGYALLIPYWSNEFGGTLLYIDEMYVKPEARGRGIGTSFFRYLDETRPFDAVALDWRSVPTMDARGGSTNLWASPGARIRFLPAGYPMHQLFIAEDNPRLQCSHFDRNVKEITTTCSRHRYRISSTDEATFESKTATARQETLTCTTTTSNN